MKLFIFINFNEIILKFIDDLLIILKKLFYLLIIFHMLNVTLYFLIENLIFILLIFLFTN
jgi:hypothetical protein